MAIVIGAGDTEAAPVPQVEAPIAGEGPAVQRSVKDAVGERADAPVSRGAPQAHAENQAGEAPLARREAWLPRAAATPRADRSTWVVKKTGPVIAAPDAVAARLPWGLAQGARQWGRVAPATMLEVFRAKEAVVGANAANAPCVTWAASATPPTAWAVPPPVLAGATARIAHQLPVF